MTVSGLPYPKRDGDFRCMECGRKPPPSRGKRRHVAVAMGIIPGFNHTHLSRRYRAVITPLTMRVQRLAPNSELAWARERFKDRYHWIDVQVIRRPKRRMKGEPWNLLETLSDFESAILTGALARRLRDAARVLAEEAARRRALWPHQRKLLERAETATIPVSFWSQQFMWSKSLVRQFKER